MDSNTFSCLSFPVSIESQYMIYEWNCKYLRFKTLQDSAYILFLVYILNQVNMQSESSGQRISGFLKKIIQNYKNQPISFLMIPHPKLLQTSKLHNHYLDFHSTVMWFWTSFKYSISTFQYIHTPKLRGLPSSNLGHHVCKIPRPTQPLKYIIQKRRYYYFEMWRKKPKELTNASITMKALKLNHR